MDVRQTDTFRDWMRSLRDERAKARILARIQRATTGNLGDVKPVGSGVNELRIDHGPGYRVYFVRRGNALVVLLCGGDKSTQGRDIKRAIKMAAEVEV